MKKKTILKKERQGKTKIKININITFHLYNMSSFSMPWKLSIYLLNSLFFHIYSHRVYITVFCELNWQIPFLPSLFVITQVHFLLVGPWSRNEVHAKAEL